MQKPVRLLHYAPSISETCLLSYPAMVFSLYSQQTVLLPMPNSLLCKLIRFTHTWQFLCMLFIEDFFFYWIHRFLHHPYLYKKIHKIHHEFDFTIAYMTLYCHWAEFVMGDLFPVSSAMFIFQDKIHVFTIAMYATYTLTKTHHMHSGYKFKIFPYGL